jgi:polyisoprenoid-binding protein YceI
MGERMNSTGARSLYNRAMNLRLLLSTLLLPALIAACQTTVPQPTAAAPAWPELRAEYQSLVGSGTVYAVDSAASKVRIYTFRAGAAARLGHNHVLSAPRFEGYVLLPSQQAADARFELRVPLDELAVDDPAARAETAGNFAGDRSAADIAGTRANMLGERGLDAARFPQMRLRSVAIEGDWPVLVAQVEVTLHGVSRTQPVMLRVERSAATLKVGGTLVLRQSDFGIVPFSALGGLLSVQDAVAVSFELTAARDSG